MKQFAIIGLSYFGKRVLDELMNLNVEVLVIDKDREVIDLYRNSPVAAVMLDVLNEESVRKVLPPSIDAVVVDLGDKIEASILVTSYCRKMGIKKIVVKAETEQHAEILELVGATQVVFPNWEAAKRITPLMLSSHMLNYLPISRNLVIAELEIPERLIGTSVVEADLRRRHGLNVIAVKNGDEGDYEYFAPHYRFKTADVALVAGDEGAIASFAQVDLRKGSPAGRSGLLGRLLRRDKKPPR